jgi:hypothetical protein
MPDEGIAERAEVVVLQYAVLSRVASEALNQVMSERVRPADGQAA